jgi:N-acetylglucosamine malate deacetylase 1
MKQRLKKAVLAAWRSVVPKTARNSLRLWLMLDIPDQAPQLIEQFAEPSVIVLAPHMDDEVIGPGGTVALHQRAGSAITFVFMTDGLASDPELKPGRMPADELQRRLRALGETRKNESRAAAKLLGVSDLRFLEGPDGSLEETPAILQQFCKILEERKPDLIYAPSLVDNHRDHWATNRTLRIALDRLSPAITAKLIIRGYEVWTPLPANRMADISTVAELKRQAIDLFHSQTRFVDYTRAILGLNQYRSMMHLHGNGTAEAFWESTVEEYKALFDRAVLERRES